MEFSHPVLRAEVTDLAPIDVLTPDMVADVFARFNQGEVPLLPAESGFKVVIDHRPPGHEDDYLSAEEYATYASRREIAVAAPGTRLHKHDCGHVAIDMLMLRSASVGDLVSQAATNALATGRVKDFLAFDTLGDNMGILYEFGQYDVPDVAFGLEVVGEVRTCLETLSKLYADDYHTQRAIFEAAWLDLRLDTHLGNIYMQSTSLS